MLLVNKPLSVNVLKKTAKTMFGGFVKAVVDIDRQIMVIDAPMHADEEKFLLDSGSNQENLWGINLYPDLPPDKYIEFDSMINLRPQIKNFSRSVENKETRKQIINIVNKLIKR